MQAEEMVRSYLIPLVVFMPGNKIPKYVGTKLTTHIWPRMGGSINNCQHTDGRNVDKRNMN
jgi:hypothetical protein